jgi:hypothetical protein
MSNARACDQLLDGYNALTRLGNVEFEIHSGAASARRAAPTNRQTAWLPSKANILGNRAVWDQILLVTVLIPSAS